MKTIRISEILNLLKEGVDRNGIAEKYGLTKVEITELFKHEKLKGKRVVKKKEVSFEILDDTDEDGEEETLINSPALEVELSAPSPEVEDSVVSTEEVTEEASSSDKW